MGKVMCAWITGVLFASAWWSLTVVPYKAGGGHWIMPVLATIGMTVLIGLFIMKHWHD